MKLWLWFVIMTVLCWGAYVPAIHQGQLAIGGKSRALWAFLFVGVAYVVVAVLIPLGLLMSRGELTPAPPGKGMMISAIAGVLGAVGALGVILALMSGGKPIAVPPLVFAGAPIVATLIGLMLHRPTKMPSPMFFVGIVLAAVGAAMVLRFKPS